MAVNRAIGLFRVTSPQATTLKLVYRDDGAVNNGCAVLLPAGVYIGTSREAATSWETELFEMTAGR